MSFKFRFAILFSLSVFIILAVSAISIAILNEEFRRDEFYLRLKSEAKKTSGQHFQNQLTVEEKQPTTVFLQTLLPDEQIAVFDTSFRVLYVRPASYQPIIPQGYLDKAKANKSSFYSQDKRETVIIYEANPVPHYVMATGYDRYGRSKSNNLLYILVFSVIGGLILSAFLAFFYVRQLIKPLNDLKEQMQRINEQNLTERLVITDADDELNKIARNFNDMLDRLENSFDTRKSFVQHASHELRTPMANMLSQTEVALNQDLSKEQYRNILLSLKEDQQDMISLTNSLLLLSQYETLADLDDWTPIRIDELVYETIDITKNVYRNAIISVDFETIPEDESELIFRGNELLVKSALQNLIRNACNYSEDNLVTVTINAQKKGISLCFNNKGKLLSKEEQQGLFIPFFRGENSIGRKGFGLGLSIVQRILALHKATVQYQALPGDINRFIVFLPRITK